MDGTPSAVTALFSRQHAISRVKTAEERHFMSPPEMSAQQRLMIALERAAGAFARLDQALSMHPLRSAFLYRFRLDAVRRQAMVDGQLIEPWHLAALLEGARLRMDPWLSLAERGDIFDAARHALSMHQWIVEPDFDQEGEIQVAMKAIARDVARTSPLLGAAHAAHAWLARGGRRAPLRGALIRFWQQSRLLHLPVPITGPQALGGDLPFDRESWIPLLLHALANEAAAAQDLLRDLERAWQVARASIGKRRKNSRAAAAIDILAATPIISAKSLADRLGMNVANAHALLGELLEAGLVVELSHRSKRRLFGLAGMGRMRDYVAPPRRPQPGRRRGRPRLEPEMPHSAPPAELPPAPSGGVLPRLAFDFSDLEAAMAAADAAIRETRISLDRIRQAGRSE